jgi:CheY-like chemotaxis protein
MIPAGDSDTVDRPRMQGRSRGAADKVNKKLALVSILIHPSRIKADKQSAPLDILIVDDNPTNILVGRRILEMLGYKDIPSASNGLEGFEMAEKTHYDLILMDIQMPVMDGYTSLKRIMASPLTGHPCVVALTANADMVSQTHPPLWI